MKSPQPSLQSHIHPPAHKRNKKTRRSIHNRIGAVMDHIQAYYFDGPTHLAQDAGISHSALSRLLHGQSSPSYALVWAITKALERRLHRTINPCDLVSMDGSYSTASVCKLVGCVGCLPKMIYDSEGKILPAYLNVCRGKWSVSVSASGTRLEVLDKESDREPSTHPT